MKIEIGDYIRTKQGTIGQIIEKYEKYCVIANRRGEIDVLYENIAKHSKNIIDLVEVGDYVNGYLINYIADDEKAIYHDALDFVDVQKFENKDIKSIVTKEQFSNMEYRL